LWIDAILSVYKYNIGLADYFIFKFYEKSHAERDTWVGTGFKYEFDLIMNPISNRDILFNKIKFHNEYKDLIAQKMWSIQELSDENFVFSDLKSEQSSLIVLKDSYGQCGWGVEILDLNNFRSKDYLVQYMKEKGFDLVEEYIIQHSELNRLSNTAVNTVRIITQIVSNKRVEHIGPTLRISINTKVDNMAMGNIAAPIDIHTGIVNVLLYIKILLNQMKLSTLLQKR
jgi:hypothetical protein